MDSGYRRTIKDWFLAQFSESEFTGKAGVRIRYAHNMLEEDRPVLVMALGRTEFIEKYHEVCWNLRNENLSLFLYDHCGQGKSGRLLADRQKGHIDHFDTYLSDLRYLIEARIKRFCSGPLTLLGYSMGGTIGVLFADAYPHLLDRLILTSPMLQINTGRLLQPTLVEAVSRLMTRLGMGENYVWGGGPFDHKTEFEGNVLTSDKVRYHYNLDLMRTTEGVRLGSPTFRWMREAYRAMRVARQLGDRINCPVVILQGKQDLLVSRSAMERFASTINGCRMIRYPEARHELLMERDHIREKVLKDITGSIN